MNVKKGLIVYHNYFGKGELVEKHKDMSLVLWDKTPDLEYNCGQNPCVAFNYRLFPTKKQALKELKNKANKEDYPWKRARAYSANASPKIW